MRYHGGKQRVGSEIANIIHTYKIKEERRRKKKYTAYCEPFCGMCGVYKHFILSYPGKIDIKFKFYAGDINGSVICLWKSLQKNWQPPLDVTKEEFEYYKNKEDSAIKGFVGISKSFNGIFFQSYVEEYNVSHAAKTLKEHSDVMKDVKFNCGEYLQYTKLRNTVIYMDPPYSKVNSHYKQKDGSKVFDLELFFIWATFMTKKGNLVFISGYEKPPIFCQLIYTSTIVRKWKGHSLPDEKLFLVLDQ